MAYNYFENIWTPDFTDRCKMQENYDVPRISMCGSDSTFNDGRPN